MWARCRRPNEDHSDSFAPLVCFTLCLVSSPSLFLVSLSCVFFFVQARVIVVALGRPEWVEEEEGALGCAEDGAEECEVAGFSILLLDNKSSCAKGPTKGFKEESCMLKMRHK